MKKLIAIAGGLFLSASPAFADWTPLITTSMFTGIQTDLGTAAAGIIACVIIVLGVGILIGAMRH